FAQSLTSDAGAQSGVETVVEELVMNALYNAPHDGDAARYMHLHRSEPVKLQSAEAAKLSYACDGYRLHIGVSDPFGRLTADTILAHIEARLSGNSEPLTGSGGGGFGIFTIYQSSSSLVVNLDPGKRTEVVSIIDLTHPFHEVKRDAKSFHLFYGK